MLALKSKMRWGLVLAGWMIMGPALRLATAGIAVAPLKQEISIKPGEDGKVTLSLMFHNRNDGDVAQKVKLGLVDVQVSDAGALSFKEPGSLPASASKWGTLSNTEVAMEPGQAHQVECTISIPQSAAPGEYYTAVMVTLGQAGKTASGVSVQ